MRAAIQKHGTAAVAAVALVTAMTGTILAHFWPEGAEVAKKSHQSIAPIVNAMAEEVAELSDGLAVEKTKRRELARRVHLLEERLMDHDAAVMVRERVRAEEAPAPTAAEGEDENEAFGPPGGLVDKPPPAAPDARRLLKQVPTFDNLK